MRSDLARLLREKSCFLFDLDGTLVDSSPCHERAYLRALEARFPEIARSFSYERFKGRRTSDALRALGIEDDALVHELTEAKQQLYREQVESGAVVLLPFAREVLEALRRQDKRLFLVTGGSRRSTLSVLRNLGIAERFELIITADDVEHGKPAPDCWLACMERAGISPPAALAVEDARSGIVSARAAGIDSIAINNRELADLPEYAGSLRDLSAACQEPA
jgi:HAD superfamily hydrolase (TIGR01509 family)